MNIQKMSRVGFLLIALVMFFFSSQPGEESNDLSDSVAELIQIEQDGSYLHLSVQPLVLGLNLRKMAHIAVFAVLGSLAFLSLDFKIIQWKKALYAISVSYFYACFDEIHQAFIPERAGSFGDTLIDLFGILLGIFMILVLNEIFLNIYYERSLNAGR